MALSHIINNSPFAFGEERLLQEQFRKVWLKEVFFLFSLGSSVESLVLILFCSEKKKKKKKKLDETMFQVPFKQATQTTHKSHMNFWNLSTKVGGEAT